MNDVWDVGAGGVTRRTLSLLQLGVAEQEQNCGRQKRHGGRFHPQHQEETTFTEGRGHLSCPRLKNLILAVDVTEMEKLRAKDAVLAVGRVSGVAVKVNCGSH